MSETLIAIDPGNRTGFVSVNKVTAEVYESVEIDDWWDVGLRVVELLRQDPDLEVVMERFTINAATHKKSPQPTAFYIIGTIKWVMKAYHNKEVPLQSPADAKSFSTNDKLKAVGFWHVGGEGHANDAFRHALLYMVRNQTLSDPRILLQ